MTDKLILASSSPRRIELLKNCHIKFETVKHGFDEDSVKIKNPVKLAKALAYEKANSIACLDKYKDEYVLGVDTIVAYKNHILGKPKDKYEANKFINLISNKMHKVITGFCIININKNINIIKSVTSNVYFIKFPQNFIKYYLDNNLWSGYAGGYAIQSIFSMFAKKIKGSYSNIVGLPVDILYEELQKINFKMVW